MRVSGQLNTQLRLSDFHRFHDRKPRVSSTGIIDLYLWARLNLFRLQGQWNESLMSTHTFVNIQKGSTTIARWEKKKEKNGKFGEKSNFGEKSAFEGKEGDIWTSRPNQALQHRASHCRSWVSKNRICIKNWWIWHSWRLWVSRIEVDKRFQLKIMPNLFYLDCVNQTWL